MSMGIIDFKATKCKHCYKCVRYCEVKAIQSQGRARRDYAGTNAFSAATACESARSPQKDAQQRPGK